LERLVWDAAYALQNADLDSESGEASPSIGNAKGAGVLYSIQPNIEISADQLEIGRDDAVLGIL
jgi:hypothetical protein